MSKDENDIVCNNAKTSFPASSGRKTSLYRVQNSIRRIGLSFGGSSF